MTKGELVELVKISLGDDGRLHDNTVAFDLSLAWEQALGEITKRNKAVLDFYCVEYDDVAVQKNVRTGEYYSMLPVPIIEGMNISHGVRRINYLKDRSLSFVPGTGLNIDLMRDLDAFHVMDDILFMVKKDRIVYYNMPSGISSVKMDLVPPFNAMDEDDEFPLPIGSSQYIVEMVAAFFKGTPYVDIRRRKINIDTD